MPGTIRDMSQTTVPRGSIPVAAGPEAAGRPPPRAGSVGPPPPAEDILRSPPRWLRALRYGSLLVPLLLALAWGAVSYRQEMRAAVARTTDNVALVRQYVERLIQTQTILHAAAYERARSEPSEFLRSGEFHRFLAGLEGSQDFLLGLAVVSSEGRYVASSMTFPVEGRPGPRHYIDAVAAGAEVFVDRIVLGADGPGGLEGPVGTDAFIVATPLRTAQFDGVIVSTVATATVTDFLQGIVAGRNETASLLREDGLLLMRSVPSQPMVLGPDAPGMLAIRGGEQGNFRAVARTDGVDRLYAFNRLANLPLYANFGTPAAIVHERWLAHVWPVWALLGAVGLFTFFAGGQVQRSVAARIAGEDSAKRLREAEALAAQRTRLLHEMNHRIKNNLSLVVSMIGLQMRQEGQIDGAALKARIRAISEVHDLMYQSDDGVRVDLGRVLNEIASSPAIVPKELGTAVVCNLEHGIMLSPDMTTPLAIIAAELMVNAVKHAFPDRSDGRISLRLRREADGRHAVLVLRDNGVGLEHSSARRSGGAIVHAFVDQIGGRLEQSSDKGAIFRLTFPLELPASA